MDKVIWLKHGIVGDETNEHIDNMACFVEPGVVALAWTEDKTSLQYQYVAKRIIPSKKSVTLKGIILKLSKFPMPTPLFMTKEEAKGIKKCINPPNLGLVEIN